MLGLRTTTLDGRQPGAIRGLLRTLLPAICGLPVIYATPSPDGSVDLRWPAILAIGLGASRDLGIPGLMFRLGTIAPERIAAYEQEGEIVPTQHSSRYWPDAEGSIDVGVRCLASLALGILASS